MQKPLFLLASVVLFLTLTACTTTPPVDDPTASGSSSSPNSTAYVGPGCKVGGCSNHVCFNADGESMMTTCEWRDSYACYQTARCELQDDGECGWSQTDALIACLGTGQ